MLASFICFLFGHEWIIKEGHKTYCSFCYEGLEWEEKEEGSKDGI